jgi:hypothetical protein
MLREGYGPAAKHGRNHTIAGGMDFGTAFVTEEHTRRPVRDDRSSAVEFIGAVQTDIRTDLAIIRLYLLPHATPVKPEQAPSASQAGRDRFSLDEMAFRPRTTAESAKCPSGACRVAPEAVGRRNTRLRYTVPYIQSVLVRPQTDAQENVTLVPVSVVRWCRRRRSRLSRRFRNLRYRWR